MALVLLVYRQDCPYVCSCFSPIPLTQIVLRNFSLHAPKDELGCQATAAALNMIVLTLASAIRFRRTRCLDIFLAAQTWRKFAPLRFSIHDCCLVLSK